MALNFPLDTSQPYVDPSSGLKYVFNPAVGAWESAVQPPVIVSEYPPADIRIPGFLYWDKNDGNLYIYYTDADSSQWIQATPNPEVPRAFIGPNPPSSPSPGDLWWDSDDARLFIYYDDIDSSQWVDASPASLTTQNAPVTISETPPINPLIGALWWNTLDGNLYVWYEDPDGGEAWVSANAAIGIGTTGSTTLVEGTLPVEITGPPSRPVISVRVATNTDTGVLRLATQGEVNAKVATNLVLTPGTLAAGIDNYVPDATTTAKGKLRIATQIEVNAGIATNLAVTPATLAASPLISGVPPGVIAIWRGSTAPAGWVFCWGQSAAPYPNLLALGLTDLPDYRGEFLRGWDAGRGVDVGRGLATFQGQTVQAHSHLAYGTISGTAPPTLIRWLGEVQQNNIFCLMNTQVNILNSFVNSQTSYPLEGIWSETRPRNIAVNYIMKT